MTYKLHHGDCLEVLRTMPDCSVDAIVTDPPYGLSFMGKKWDYEVPSVEVWAECLRVLKHGGHLLAFAGTRTQHRMAVRIEDAGFEIRDMIAWVYGSGFPKSLDVSKAIDKKPEAKYTKEFKKWLEKQIKDSGKSRKEIDDACGFTACSYCKTDGKDYWSTNHPSQEKWVKMKDVIGLSDEWDWIITDNIKERGFIEPTGGLAGGSGNTIGNFSGRQLSHNPISTDAMKWQGWGTSLKPAMEPITVARKPLIGTVAENVLQHGTGAINVDGCRVETEDNLNGGGYSGGTPKTMFRRLGRLQPDEYKQPTGRWPANFIHDGSDEVVGLLNEAARYFYCSKASKADRGENHHPTVKPTDLMRYLCRLVTPPNGIVLDPFNGSGSTGCAAILEGFQYIGIEREAEYIAISEKRIQARTRQPKQLTLL